MLKVPAGVFFFANAGGKGYYRSAYTPSVYAALVEQAETTLTPAERISLIGDQWAQARANKVPIGAYLDLVAAVKADPGAEVLDEAFSGVKTTYTHIAASAEERAGLSAWIRSTYSPVHARLSPPAESDSANTRELRADLFGLLGQRGKDPAVLAQAREISARYLTDPGSVDATMGQTALSIAARHGDAALFDQLQKIYETSTNPEFQEGALRLLAQFADPALVQRSLDYALSGKVRNQDAVIQIVIALQIDTNREQAWKYIQNNWEKVQSQFTTEMGAMLVGATGSFCSAEDRTSVEQFFSTHKVASSDKSLKHAIERIDGCIELRTLQEPNLKQWLAAQVKP
jgi:aminopeptidase N/puromycin-sensitive aminopeptidase